MKQCSLLMAFFLFSSSNAKAQGCIPIRNTAGLGQFSSTAFTPSENRWTLQVNNRYYKSFRSFRGETDRKLPKALYPINYVYSLELGLNRTLKGNWNLALYLPLSSNTRSNPFEHDTVRHATRSFGLGDVRVGVYKWLFTPSASQRGNVQWGLGLKLPTGDYRYQDYFHQRAGDPVLDAVDQSIQLGDGGTGITAELNAYYSLHERIGLYGNFFYLVNPREQNGVSTAKGKPISSLSRRVGSQVMSVPDQYSTRAGAEATLGNLVVSAGMRYEGVPVHDLLGGSGGFRRPGYTLSVEPGARYKLNRTALHAFVAVPVKRATLQSVPDKRASEVVGYTITPGAFADYIVFVGAAFRL